MIAVSMDVIQAMIQRRVHRDRMTRRDGVAPSLGARSHYHRVQFESVGRLKVLDDKQGLCISVCSESVMIVYDCVDD